MGRRRGSSPGGAAARYRVALLAGAVCGGVSALVVAVLLEGATREGLAVPLLAGVWAVSGLVTAAVLLRPARSRERWGRAAIVTGLHALALPAATAISCVVAGARWTPAEPSPLELTATVLGVRLATSPMAVRLGVGGFVLGLLLLSIGDRALRGLRRTGNLGGLPR
jgi:hypothetical protein